MRDVVKLSIATNAMGLLLFFLLAAVLSCTQAYVQPVHRSRVVSLSSTAVKYDLARYEEKSCMSTSRMQMYAPTAARVTNLLEVASLLHILVLHEKHCLPSSDTVFSTPVSLGLNFMLEHIHASTRLYLDEEGSS